MTAFSTEQALPIPRVEAGDSLPLIDLDYARRVRAAGHIRIGIGPWIVRGDGMIFMQEHVESDKTRPGALGTMSETVRWLPLTDRPPIIEQPADTMSFGFYQENGITDTNELGLRIAPSNGWLVHAVPVSYHDDSPTIVGIWPSLTISDSGADRLTENFTPTKEVSAVGFMSEADIRQRRKEDFRFNMKDWLLKAISEGYIGSGDGHENAHKVPLPFNPGVTASAPHTFYCDMDLRSDDFYRPGPDPVQSSFQQLLRHDQR